MVSHLHRLSTFLAPRSVFTLITIPFPTSALFSIVTEVVAASPSPPQPAHTEDFTSLPTVPCALEGCSCLQMGPGTL